MTSPSHSAAAPALGYGAQVSHGLLVLLDLAFRQPGSITLEVFDDLEMLTGNERSFQQIKNKPGTPRDLSDSSPDVWHTLDNWRSLWLARSVDEALRFLLVTTQTAAMGSAMADLRFGSAGDAVECAAARLAKVATESRNVSTARARAEWMKLSSDEQRALLRCVEVHDAAADASQLQARLLEVPMLRALVDDPDQLPSLVDSLLGWWTRRSLLHLHRVARGFADRIDAGELEAQMGDARRQHSSDALPVYREIQAEDEREESDRDVYLHQLHVIQAPAHRIRRARQNYRRAYAHRSRWGRMGLVTDDELEQFEDVLVEEWELHRDDLGQPPCRDETEECSRGLELLIRAEQVQHRLRSVEEPFLARGTYHSLADRRELGWHPRWEALVNGRTSGRS